MENFCVTIMLKYGIVGPESYTSMSKSKNQHGTKLLNHAQRAAEKNSTPTNLNALAIVLSSILYVGKEVFP